MKKIITLKDNICGLIISLPLVWSLTMISAQMIDITLNGIEILLTALICTVVFRLLFYNIYTGLFTLFFTAIVLMQVLYDIQLNPDNIIYRYASDVFNNVVQYFTGEIPSNSVVITFISYTLTAIFSLIAVFTVFKKKRSVIYIVLSFMLIFTSIMFGHTIPLYYYVVWLVSELILLWRYFITANETYSWKMIPVCALCVAIAFFLPDISFGALSSAVNDIVSVPLRLVNDNIYKITGPRFFSLNQYGYNSELGGDIELSDDPVMTVKSGLPIYLAGIKYDVYTGSSWISSEDSDTWLPNGQHGESIEFLERMTSNLLMSFAMGEMDSFAELLSTETDGQKTMMLMPMQAYPVRQAEITLKDRTFNLHSVPLTVSYESTGEPKLNSYGSIISNKLLTEDTSYTISYRDNGTVSYWQEIMNRSYHGVLNDISMKLKELHQTYDFSPNQEGVMLVEGPVPNTNLHYISTYSTDKTPFENGEAIPYETLLNEILIPYSEKIYEIYTQLPDVYPERIMKLTEDIVMNCENDYDKASSIARYLRQFPYTLSPGDPDTDKDFVDQFLFDNQTGYCQYYATAFTVMCRSIGIPTRYVEGFYTSSKKEDGVYTVTSKQAHAWGEVYLEGYGWVIFNPTSSSETLSPSRGYLGEVLEAHLSGKYDDMGNEYIPNEITKEINLIYSNEETSIAPLKISTYIILPFVIMVLLYIMTIVYKVCLRFLRRLRYKQMKSKNAVYWIVKRLKNILNNDINKSLYKTLRQELKSNSIGDIETYINEIILVYEKYRYSVSINGTEDKKDKEIVWKNLSQIYIYKRQRKTFLFKIITLPNI